LRVVVVGAGAIGSTVAWFLARGGHEVAVVDVRRDHLDAIARDGLVAEPSGDVVRVDTEPGREPPAELVLVATKAFATEEAARGAAHLAGAETLVATVQNGIGTESVLAEVFGSERVLAGTTTIAAELTGPGRVRIADATLGGRSQTVLGCPPGVPDLLPRVEALCAVLSEAGLPAVAVVDAAPARWRKLAFAGSMGALSGLLDATVEETLASAPDVLVALIDEIVMVARAEGVALDPDETRDAALATFTELGPHRASLTVDLAEGRRTEIDALCLEVARRGAALGVATPVNEVVGRLVSARERR
jgi:2-dehydropantoate 2-reductase